MVRYKSRIGAGTAVRKIAKARARKARAKPLPPPPEAESSPQIPEVADVVDVGGAVSTGGIINTGGAIKTGGRVSTGGRAPDVDSFTYPEMIHTLGAMDPHQYHILKGVASGFFPNVLHPMKRPAMRALGGSFVHPAVISKNATMDIIKAPTAQALSGALHEEWLSQKRGANVGGGLFSSLKNVFKKGLSGLSRGARSALMIGRKLSGALKTGRDIAKTVQAPLSVISPGAAELLGRGLSTAERLEESLERGLAVADPVTAGLERVAAAVQ